MKLQITGNDRTPGGGLRERLVWPWLGAGFVLGCTNWGSGWTGLLITVVVNAFVIQLAYRLTRRPVQPVNLRRKDGTPVYLVVPVESAKVLNGEQE